MTPQRDERLGDGKERGIQWAGGVGLHVLPQATLSVLLRKKSKIK